MRRRPRRHIEVFGVSALDLFASALGAFILVTMILFPYYGDSRAAADQLAAARLDLARSEADLRDARARLDGMRGSGPPFVEVQIRWAAVGVDVDLHVTDPGGHEFYWYKANLGGADYPGSAAASSFDMSSGPAVELWQDPSAQPGDYQIDYVANALPEGISVDVSGSVVDRTGRRELEVQTLRQARQRVRAATVTVEPDGRVSLK